MSTLPVIRLPSVSFANETPVSCCVPPRAWGRAQQGGDNVDGDNGTG